MSDYAYLDNRRLNEYLDGQLCREERQFAAMLYSIFLQEKKKENGTEHPIVKRCLNLKDITTPIKIKEVYFEATLMRDFFENDRINFNRQLLKYCLGWMHIEIDGEVHKFMDELEITLNGIKSSRNLGQRKVKKMIREKYSKLKIEDEEIKIACLDIAGMMMNATPDLLIVYEYETNGKANNASNSNIHVKSLECKYLSQEGTYIVVTGARYKMQFIIQKCIMQFCFGNSEKEVIPPSSPSSRGAGKNNLWDSAYGEAFKEILTQDWQSKDLSNAGVGIIQFKKKADEKNIADDSVPIYIDELMTYFNETGEK